MRHRPTQKELAVRFLAKSIGTWFASYELVQKEVDGHFTGITPMERLYEIIRDGGHYDSPNNRYTVETKKEGKFAYFRVSKKEPIKHERVFIKGMGSLKDYTMMNA